MEIPYGLGTQALALPPALDPLYSAAAEQLLVELLQIQRSEFAQ